MNTDTVSDDRITLYYRDGGSDKVYQAAVAPSGTGFIVNFAFGRRGCTLQTGSKTPRPVSYEQAKKVYDALVKEKTAKGYTPGEDGTPYAGTAKGAQATGVLPQLLNPIDEPEAQRLIADDGWWAQEKFDGKRVLIRKRGAEISGINRSGLLIGLPEPVLEAVRLLDAESCLLDGEAVGEVYHCFDLLEQGGLDLRLSPYTLRYDRVVNLVDNVPSDQLRFADIATTARAKQLMLDRLRREKREGAVFKDRSAPYASGRPASGGGQLKLKFYATASCVVTGRNGTRRSVALELSDGSGRVGVGNVTIPANQAVPDPGEVVEVRYLYAYPGGSLYQPFYLGLRDDVNIAACRTDQLKYRGADGEDEG